jgi:hypothetical protein
MNSLTTLIFLILFAVLSLAAVTILFLAISTVGLGGFLPFSNVSEKVRRRARPYRRWFLIILILTALVCVLLALIQMIS